MDTLPAQDILLSCKNLEQLEAVTEQYVKMAHILTERCWWRCNPDILVKLFRNLPGLRSAECDSHIGQRISLELLETRLNLQNLQQTLQHTARLEQECQTMIKFAKDRRIYEMIDEMFLDLASQVYVNPSAVAGTKQMTATRGAQEDLMDTLENTARSTTIGVHETSPERPVAPKPRLVTDDELALVPSYLRGRITTEKLNETYEMIREVTELKYQLLQKTKKTMTCEEREAITRMRAEVVPALKATRFITEGDIKLFKNRKVPKVVMTHLSVLRNLHRIREIREKNILRVVIDS